jgi:putative phage-type endonuclease
MSIERIILASREEWLKHRSRIGGSDASAIVGLNPYKTNTELYLEKTWQKESEDISHKPYVQYGTKAEEHLRELFRLDFPQYKVQYFDNNMFLNSKYPFAHASLDGELTDEDGRRGILEIKTTNILQSMQKEKWRDRIPDNYFIQVLHYLMVTEFDFVVLKAQLKSEFGGQIYLQTKHYFIERSEVVGDIEYLAEEERKFWQCVQARKKPDLILPDI